ncbi:polysaccharide deacetylase family protein [Carboxylicivirga caseinilyticus]|uniref:polysaccharide deacetylase family protein n=1 Tax=Carboxylicivirga caseinilyticus TaxID=3417572 RepID=UPI003D348EFA|nr:polysaccharide deacetylase family protein [Marinilabiliaceae bacterium A049]
MSWKVRPPQVIRNLFPGTTWRMPEQEKVIYFTFDDGPVEKETPWVMNLLNQYQIKATFFCVGENADNNQHLIQELLNNGHSVGNHAYNHLPAWKCSRSEYFNNIDKARPYIPGNLFRPPHGQLYPWYMKELKSKFSKVVMWDVLSMDYDKRLSKEQVLSNVTDNVRNGSVVVFHDSAKAWERLNYALPKSLDFLLEKGYRFEVLKMD